MGYKAKSAFQRFVVLIVMVLLAGSGVFAQDDVSPGELLKRAIKMSESGNNQEAILLMYQYLEIVEESEADRVIAIAQDIRFKLSRLLIAEEQLEEAADVLQTYAATKLCKFPRAALRMLATCYYELGKPEAPGAPPDVKALEKCVVAVRDAIEYNENPVVVVKAVAEDSGVQAVDDGPTDEEYTSDELVMLNLTLAESLFMLKQWTESIEPFTYVIENTTEEQRKGYAIMQVINALIEIPDFDRIAEWIPQLYRTNARYDIRVNLALMNVAQALYTAGEYDNALPLYRMILPRDEVIAFQQERLRKMRLAANMIPVGGMEVDPIEFMLFSDEQADQKKEDAGEESDDEDKPKELVELENLIAALQKLPAYENNIAYRMGQLYEEVDRYWEAVEFFDAVYAKEQDTDLGHRAVADVVTLLLENLDEVDEARQRGFAHLGTYTNGISPRQITYTFTGHFQKRQEWEELKELMPYLDNFDSTNDTDIIRYDTELYFMQGVADLMLYKYAEAEKGFKKVLDNFPGSHQEGNALYWYSMSMLFQQNYTNAWEGFEKYIAEHTEGDWVDEAYFQGGICLFGQEKYIDASNRFSYVIDNFPTSVVYPNASSMRGDLSGAAGELEFAISDYKNAIAAATTLKNVKQATYATFQMAAIYEAWAEAFDDRALAQEKYDELITIVQSYLDIWGGEADVAKALFWIGKIMILTDRVDEAVETYLGAIIDYGGDVLQDGVDMMITELVKVSRIWLGVEAQGQLMNDIQTALDETEDPVLKLRLRVLLAKLDNTEIELGKRLIAELPTLDNASPPVLAAICDASFEMKDYSRAKELLDIFTSRFEESDYVRAAYKLQAYAQYTEGDFEGALATIDEVQGFYGHDRDVVWAQLMMARIFLAKGQLEEARKANMYVLSVREWRGEPVAEATFQMGQVEEQAGDLRKAFGFYQRTYVQYQGHAGGYWAAESYLASARCLEQLGLEDELMMTYEAMLYNRFVSLLPQADLAREALGEARASEIKAFINSGQTTNLVIAVDTGGMVDTTLINTNAAESVEADVVNVEPAETDSETTSQEEPDIDEPSEERTETVGMESE